MARGSVRPYTYDGFDRVANRNGTAFRYAGRELDPVSDGTWSYARSPSGDLLALDDTTTADPARDAVRDRHGDLIGLLNPTTGTLTDTYAYDPFGDPTSSAGPATGALDPQVGYQTDWTDPTTTQVWMGARWYEADLDTFTARDTPDGQLRTPVSLNRYTYAQDDPLEYHDPDGQMARKTSCDIWCQIRLNLSRPKLTKCRGTCQRVPQSRGGRGGGSISAGIPGAGARVSSGVRPPSGARPASPAPRSGPISLFGNTIGNAGSLGLTGNAKGVQSVRPRNASIFGPRAGQGTYGPSLEIGGKAQKAWCAKNGIIACTVAIVQTERANKRANNLATSLTEQQVNAFRHAFWSALLTASLGKDKANNLTLAHELDNLDAAANQPNDVLIDELRDSLIDTRNNYLGRQIGADAAQGDSYSVSAIYDRVMGAVLSNGLCPPNCGRGGIP